MNEERNGQAAHSGHEGGEDHGPLTFTLALRGELVPEVASNGRDVHFVDSEGAAVLCHATQVKNIWVPYGE